MPSLRIRLLSWLAAICILFILVVSIVFNVLLGLSRTKIIDAANAHISDRLDIGYLAYVFPNIVVIKNAVLAPLDKTSADRVVRLPTVRVEFSILEFVFHQNVAVQKLKVYSPYLHHGYLGDFLKRNGKQLMEFLLQLPRLDFRFSVKDALWDFTVTPQDPDRVRLNFVFWMKKDNIRIQGTTRKDKYVPRSRRSQALGSPLEFDLDGVLVKEGLFIDGLALSRQNLYLKLWGSLLNGKLQLNGFSFLNTYPYEEGTIKSGRQFARLRKYFEAKRQKTPPGPQEDVDLYLTDINCLARLFLPRVHLDRLEFNFNDVPVAMQGTLLFEDLFSTQLDISLDPARSRNFPLKNLNKIQVHLKGASDGRVFTSESTAHLSFDKTKNPNFPVDTIDSDLKGLRFLPDQYARPSVYLQEAQTLITAGGAVHKLFLEDAAVSLNPLSKALRLLEVKSPFYGGGLAGRIWLTTRQGNPKIDGAVLLEGVDAARLDELLFNFARARGRLSGRIHLTSVPRLVLDGRFDIYDGRLESFAFFQWLADTFNLPSLRQVDFRHVSSGFTADSDTFTFKEILLDAGNVNVRGDFAIDKNNLVNSYLSLAFSKKLLAESAKFRPVLKIFGDDIPMVVFDFQLSGRQEAMSFQWLPSEHKNMIQQRIPDFIERIIERNIDEMMHPADEPPAGTESDDKNSF